MNAVKTIFSKYQAIGVVYVNTAVLSVLGLSLPNTEYILLYYNKV